MSVLSLCITQSCEQIVAGIPKSIILSTNTPATIFYTLDGTTPTTFSDIYVSPIFLPVDQLSVVFQAFATNGTINSNIICETYQTNNVEGNVKRPHAATTAIPGASIPNEYPFGTPPFEPNQRYLNTADAGITVYNQNNSRAIPNAFDADGYPTAFSNKPYTTENYQIVYATANQEGETGQFIGNLPQVSYHPFSDVQPDRGIQSNQGPEYTNQFTDTFDPRAQVIFADYSLQDPNDPAQINSPYYSSENPERARDGALLTATDTETPPPSGSLVRSFYNANTGMLTSYFRDSWSNRWIISSSPYTPRPNIAINMSTQYVGRSKFTYEWVFGARRVLF